MLKELKQFHENEIEKCKLDVYLKDRLEQVLIAAKVEGKDFDEKYKHYKEALSISSRGYAIVAKRDIDELYVNFYNPEWIKSWDGNMDIQPCLDYFGVITYITDYYMKDDSGTMKFINEVLEDSMSEPIKKKLALVKNTFLTHRQIGESEVYYKLFPHLHLTASNIAAVFLPAGFPQNRSKFLKQITEEQSAYHDNVIEVEGKGGSYYIEKETMLDKHKKRPVKLTNLTYVQFVQRCESTKSVPKEYLNDQKKFLSEIVKVKLCAKNKKLKNYIIGEKDPEVGDYVITLPKYFPLNCGTQWMKLRRTLVIRFHKFKQKENPHEFYYSEMQKYLPFREEETELGLDSLAECKAIYDKNKNKIIKTRENLLHNFKLKPMKT